MIRRAHAPPKCDGSCITRMGFSKVEFDRAKRPDSARDLRKLRTPPGVSLLFQRNSVLRNFRPGDMLPQILEEAWEFSTFANPAQNQPPSGGQSQLSQFRNAIHNSCCDTGRQEVLSPPAASPKAPQAEPKRRCSPMVRRREAPLPQIAPPSHQVG